MTRDELEQLREGWAFEAKLAAGRAGRGEVPESFWESYAALANAEGGTIVLGARELEDGQLEFRGLPEADRVETELWNGLQNPQKVSVNLLRREDVARVEHGGLVALVVRVPKARRADRPVFIRGTWETGTFLRVHEGDRRLDREQARRMLADAQPELDARALDHFERGDLDDESVRKYRNRFLALRADHPFSTEDETGFLERLGVLVRDRASARLGVSRGGLLMFGREAAIRELLPSWHLSYREEAEHPLPGQRWLDRVTDDGTWNANLFEFYLRTIGKLYAALKMPFALENSQYRIDESPAHTAVREALVNALIHADHAGRAGVRVIRRGTELEFINPGLLLVSTGQLWAGGVSESRNPVLQRLFAHLQLAEREGSGGPTIRQAWSREHWRAPEVRQDAENMETHLVLRQVSLLPEAAVLALRQRVGAGFDQLEPIDRVALVAALEAGAVTHARLVDATAEHPRAVTLRLQDLVRRGLLVATPKPRTDGYQLAPLSGASSAGSSSTDSASSSTDSVPSSTDSASSSTDSGHSSPDASLRAAQPAEITAPRGYGPKSEMLEAVLGFCANDWRRVDEIAIAVDRRESTVRNEYLRPLVAQGRLELRYPDNLRHPQQAYRTRAAYS